MIERIVIQPPRAYGIWVQRPGEPNGGGWLRSPDGMFYQSPTKGILVYMLKIQPIDSATVAVVGDDGHPEIWTDSEEE